MNYKPQKLHKYFQFKLVSIVAACLPKRGLTLAITGAGNTRKTIKLNVSD